MELCTSIDLRMQAVGHQQQKAMVDGKIYYDQEKGGYISMKKYVARFLAFVMIITAMSTMAVSASAAENENGYSMQPRVSSPFPFTMFVSDASHDINTAGNSAKQFTKAGISESNVTTYGKLILTRTDGKYTAGIGYLVGGEVSGATGLYTSNQTTNTMFNRNYAVTNLVAGRTYFLYAENDSLYSCTMHGTVSADVY